MHPEFKFYLTGSRYFGVETKNSDWDFVVQDSKEVVAWLNSLGAEDHFDKTEYTKKAGAKPGYWHPTNRKFCPTRTVYQWQKDDVIVHINLAYNIERMLIIRDCLKATPPLLHGHTLAKKDHSARTRFWDSMNEILMKSVK